MSARAETFLRDGSDLLRSVVPRSGRPYEHRCTRETFVHVCHVIDERGGDTFTGAELQAATDAPFSQVFTALAFLEERGCVVGSRRRGKRAATSDVFADAMTELEALA
jgi:hypothetical protein